MYKAKSLSGKESQFEITFENKNKGTLNGKPFEWDIVEEKPGRFHILKNNKSYTAEIVSADIAEKKMHYNSEWK